MTEFVQLRGRNPKFEQALFPGIDVRYLMPANNAKPTEEEGRTLTRWHEASHAVVAAVLKHASCSEVSVADPRKPYTLTPIDRTVETRMWEPTADMIDLAGLYGELVAIEGVHGTRLAFQHIKNALWDLESARQRISLSLDAEAEWAASRGALALLIVRYFRPAIEAVAKALSEQKALRGDEVLSLIASHPPAASLPAAIGALLKPSIVELCPPSASGQP